MGYERLAQVQEIECLLEPAEVPQRRYSARDASGRRPERAEVVHQRDPAPVPVDRLVPPALPQAQREVVKCPRECDAR
jgi:hypothetical protein